jgi:parallel beta-helix repeat protein
MKKLLILLLLLAPAFATQYTQALPNLCAYYNGTNPICTANPVIYCGKGKYYQNLACAARSTACQTEGTLGACAICGTCAAAADTCGTAACGGTQLCAGACDGLGTGASHCITKAGFGVTCYCNAMCTSGYCNSTSQKCENKFKSAPNLCGFYNGTSSSCTAAINNFCANGYYYPTQACSATPTNKVCIAENVTNSCAICGNCFGVGSDTCHKADCGTTAAYGCALTCDGVATGSSSCVNKSDEGGVCHCDGQCNAPFTCESSVCRSIPANMTWVYPPTDNMNVTGNPNCRMNYTFTLTNATADYCYGFANPLGGGIIPIFPTFAPDSNTSCSFNALQGGYNYTFGVMDSNGLSNNTTTINFTCNIAQPNMAWIAPATDNQSIYGDTYNFKFSATPTWNDTSKNITNCGLYLTNSTDFYVLDGDYDNDTFICNVTASTIPPEDVTIQGYALSAYSSNETPTWTFTFTNCKNLTTPNEVYTLTKNAIPPDGTCLNVFADNVTIDCNGYTITGDNSTGSYGVYSNSTNTTTKNCIIQNFDASIFYNGANNGLILNDTTNTTFSGGMGIWLNNTNGTIITDSTSITAGAISTGIYLFYSHNNILSNISSWTTGATGYGIYLSKSRNNIITDLTSSTIGEGATGIRLAQSHNNTLANMSSATTGNDAIGMLFDAVSNNTLDNFTSTTVGNDSYGAFLSNSDRNSFTDITSTTYGDYSWDMYFQLSDLNNITRLTSTTTGDYGHNIYLWSSTGNTIRDGIFNSSYIPIYAETYSDNNTIINNTLFPEASAYAIGIDSTSNGNLFYWNSLMASAGGWVHDISGTNFYNITGQGNSYYTSDGLPACKLFNLTGFPWATGGTSQPFNNSTAVDYWFHLGEDWHPSTLECPPYVPSPVGVVNYTENYSYYFNRSIHLNRTTNRTNIYQQITTPIIPANQFFGIQFCLLGIGTIAYFGTRRYNEN